IEKILCKYRNSKTRLDPLTESLRLIRGEGPAEVMPFLQTLPSAWADHAITSVYSVLMDGGQRKRLGAYFTPPPLVDHLVSRLREFGLRLANDRVRDAAAGGAAFLVPLARMKVKAWEADKAGNAEIIRKLRSQLIGREIEQGLASLANALLRRMLIEELDIPRKRIARLELVKRGDSLDPKSAAQDQVDHEIGNPPFLRLRGDDGRL